MGRNLVLRGVVLKNNRIGEIHKGVMLFTDTAGIVSAIAHGAFSQKGKLRGVTNPFCAGTVYLYHDPVKDSYKITDFDVKSFFPGLRESVIRYYSANLWAEVILKSFGGGVSSEELFSLFLSALAKLDIADDRKAKTISFQYLFRYLDLVAAVPELTSCAMCGTPFDEDYRRPAVYEKTPERVICLRCAEATGVTPAGATAASGGAGVAARGAAVDGMETVCGPGVISLTAGAMQYLRHTSRLPWADAVEVDLDDASIYSLLNLVYHLIGELVESPLNTLEIGRSLL